MQFPNAESFFSILYFSMLHFSSGLTSSMTIREKDERSKFEKKYFCYFLFLFFFPKERLLIKIRRRWMRWCKFLYQHIPPARSLASSTLALQLLISLLSFPAFEFLLVVPGKLSSKDDKRTYASSCPLVRRYTFCLVQNGNTASHHPRLIFSS